MIEDEQARAPAKVAEPKKELSAPLCSLILVELSICSSWTYCWWERPVCQDIERKNFLYLIV